MKYSNNIQEEKINIPSIIIIVILMAGFISIIYQIGIKNVIIDMLGYKAEWVIATVKTSDNLNAPEDVKVVWKDQYPFPDPPAYEQDKIISTRSTDSETAKKGLSGKIANIYSVLEKYSSEYFSAVDQCEIVSKSVSKCLGMNLLMDAYGALVFYQPDGRMMAERSRKNVDIEISNISNLAAWLEDKDIDYFFVLVPSPVDPEDEEMIIASGYEEYSNAMADELLDGLESAGVDYLDIRSLMRRENRSYSDSFFRYDHHMLPSAGLWVAGKIAEHIDQKENLMTGDYIFDENSYMISKSGKETKGGFANTATLVYAEKEEMPLYHPTYDTDFIKDLPRYNLELTGDFDDVMYAMWDYPSYNVWNHGIQPLKTYENLKDDTADIHLLLLTDSYSDVISPFLASAYSNIDEIDLRLFTGSLEAYIKETKPDLVICVNSAYEINSSGAEALFEFD